MKFSLAKWVLAATFIGVTCVAMRAAETRTPVQDGLAYGFADGQQLTMNSYAPNGLGPEQTAKPSRLGAPDGRMAEGQAASPGTGWRRHLTAPTGATAGNGALMHLRIDKLTGPFRAGGIPVARSAREA